MSRREEPSERVDEYARVVIDAAISVHRELGPGYAESIYEEALAMELADRHVPFARQVRVGIEYKRRPVGETRLDLLVGGVLIVELKAIERLAPIHVAEAVSYLKATKLHLALLLNFDVTRLKDGGIRRVIRSIEGEWRAMNSDT